MPYLQITDFKYGLDRRRDRVAGIPGTLWDAKNCHISRGGDLQRAKKFVPTYALPAGTFGAAQVKGQLYVFGSGTTPAGLPLGVQYQQLISPSAANMTKVHHAVGQDGKLYVIASYDDGNIHHFYNGARVTDWDTLGNANGQQETLADYLSILISSSQDVSAIAYGAVITVSARVTGTPFTISATATDHGADATQAITVTSAQANVAAVTEVRATGGIAILGGTPSPGINTISSVAVDGIPLYVGSVDYLTSNEVTASRVANQITSNTASHGYSAEAIGHTVVITAAPGTGSSKNGLTVSASGNGNVAIGVSNMAAGVDAVSPVQQIETVTISGVYEDADTYTVTINGIDYSTTGMASGTGTYAFVYKQRIFVPANSLLEYCKIQDATDWHDAAAESGAGFVNMSNESEGTQRLTCAAQYGQYAAIFSAENIRLYSLSTTVSNFNYYQTLDNTGTLAPKSVGAYGNSEVFYLHSTGIRSLRARDSLNITSVNDIGTAIDTYVQEHTSGLSQGSITDAVYVIDPIDGRYWLAIGDKIFVLSYFPSSKINAWTVYEPGFIVSDFVKIKSRIYARSGDTIYLYGGESGAEYPAADEQIVEVGLPFMASGKPATFKGFKGFDMASKNVWEVSCLVDPDDETKEVTVGNLYGSTYSGSSIRMDHVGNQTHIAPKLICRKAGFASISSLAVHYDEDAST